MKEQVLETILFCLKKIFRSLHLSVGHAHVVPDELHQWKNTFFLFSFFFSQFWKNSYISKLWSDFFYYYYWSKCYFCVRTNVMCVCSGARVSASQRATLHCRSCEHLNTSGLLNNILDLLFHRGCPCYVTETTKMWTCLADIGFLLPMIIHSMKGVRF